MTDIPADVLEAAHKALMSELFFLCQPNRGDVFSWMDDHPEALKPAIARALVADRAAQAERMAKMDGGLYRKVSEADGALAAFGPCPHNCDVGGICLAAHAGFPESCALALSQEGSDANR